VKLVEMVSKVFADSPVTAYAAQVILCDATGGAIVVNLPAAAVSTGVAITVKKVDVSANTVTVDGNGTETIDGLTTKVLLTQYASTSVVCDGVGWHII
jgi:hypothetical protein